MQFSPFRLNIQGVCKADMQTQHGYYDTCKGFLRVGQIPAHGRRLAIVGSGPSAWEALNQLKVWPGEIWAINNMAARLKRHGVVAKMVTVDPGAPEEFDTEGVQIALLSTSCHPRLRERFNGYLLFDLKEFNEIDGINGGVTTAARMPMLALRLGFTDISFFGCEGSYNESTLTDFPTLLVVRAGDNEYITNLELLQQCESLSQVFNTAPEIFKDRSGGLLSAMTANPATWEVVAVSGELKQHLEEVNGPCGMYDEPYDASALHKCNSNQEILL